MSLNFLTEFSPLRPMWDGMADTVGSLLYLSVYLQYIFSPQQLAERYRSGGTIKTPAAIYVCLCGGYHGPFLSCVSMTSALCSKEPKPSNNGEPGYNPVMAMRRIPVGHQYTCIVFRLAVGVACSLCAEAVTRSLSFHMV